MNRLKQSVALTAVAAAVVLAAGWFLLLSPKHAEADALHEQVATQEQANLQLGTELEVLRDKAQALPAKKAELAEVALKLPPEPRLPDLLRALSAVAASTGVELVSVSPGGLSPVTPPVAPPAPPVPSPEATAGAAPAAAPAPAPAAAAPAAGGVSALPVTVNVTGTFYDIEQFVAELEELPRAVRLTALALAPQQDRSAGAAEAGPAGRRRLSATLSGEVYVAAEAASPALAAPGAAAVTTPGATGTGSAAPQPPAAAN